MLAIERREYGLVATLECAPVDAALLARFDARVMQRNGGHIVNMTQADSISSHFITHRQ